MPTGYTYKAWVGAVYNNASGNFIKFYQKGNVVHCVETQPLSAGTATSSTAVSLTAHVPTTAKIAFGRASNQWVSACGWTFIEMYTATLGSFATIAIGRSIATAAAPAQGYWRMGVLSSEIYYYVSSGSSANIFVCGWEY
jgi:hypothetical protein